MIDDGDDVDFILACMDNCLFFLFVFRWMKVIKESREEEE